MVDVLLTNDDVTVLGPPELIDVVIDIGPQGTRGSQTFVGVGDPNVIEIGQTPELNDLYINASPGVDYSYLYQYRSQPGGNTWVKVVKMNPVIYNLIHTTTYTAGAASITIPIEDIITVTGSSLTAENFCVKYSIAHSNPTASSMAIPALVGDDLTINFVAAERSGSTWQALAGEVTTHLTISVVL